MKRSARKAERRHHPPEKREAPALDDRRGDRIFDAAFYTCLAAITLLLGTNLYSYFTYGTFAFESGESYGDRLLNFSHARTFMEYGFNYFDPYSKQQLIFYNFFFYWMEGALAKILGMDPWKMANILQLFLGPALFVTLFHLGKVITGNRWIALVATMLTFLSGHLEFLLRGEFISIHTYGSMAIMYSFLRQLYGPYCDNYAFLIGYAALYFFWKLATSQAQRLNKRDAAFFLGLSAIAFNIQLLVALLFLALCAGILFTRTILDGDIPLRRLRPWGVAFGLLYLAALLIYQLRPPMPLIGIAIAILFGTFFWFSRQKKAYLLLMLSFVPVAAFTAISLYVVAKGGGEPFRYNDRIRELDIAFPLHVYIISYLPMLTLAAIAIWKNPDRRMRFYLAGFGITILALSFNHLLGYNNHPARFVVSSFPILCILASVGIFRLAKWKRKGTLALVSAFGILLFLGIFQNMVTYFHVAATTPHPKSPWITPTVEALDRVRAQNKDAVFYVWPLKIHTVNLTPYTGAKFFYRWLFYSDDNALNQLFTQLDKSQTIDELFRRIWGQNLSIDYVVVTGPAPTDGSEALQDQFLFQQNGVSIFKVAKPVKN